MAIKIGANFAYNGKLPNFERDSFETKAAMKAFNENNIDEGHLSYCKEDGNIYQYKSANSIDATTGKWRIFKTDIVVDATLNAVSTNPIQNKAVFNALKAKADVVALDKYQPKYSVDYIATKNFNYSELPADVKSIDLNGYTMTTNKNITISSQEFYNGTIQLDAGNQTDTCEFHHVNIDALSKYEDIGSIYKYCTINSMNATSATSIKFSVVSNTNFAGIEMGDVIFTIIKDSTFSFGSGEFFFGENVIIDDSLYKTCYIKNDKPVDKGYESNIDIPTIPGNAPSCEAVKDALQLKADKTQLNGLATKTELNGKADTSALNSYLTKTDANTTYATKDSLNSEVNQLVEEINLKLDDTVAASTYLRKDDANGTYAKKSDISNVYKFKGTKTTYDELPKTGVVTGDVWNITNADATHGIKAGDNVAWNGTAWDNLSGVTDLSGYTTKDTTDAISADVKKLMDKAFPFTVKVSLNKTLAKKGTSQAVKVTITPKIGDDNTNADEIIINGAEHHGTTPYVYSDTATATTTYNVRVRLDSRTAQGSATITFVNPSYDGAVAANFTVTEANIKALTEALRSGKGGTRTFNLNNQKACIAYPKAFGAATAIKDANGFDYLASYTRSEVNVNGELYYVYLLTNATTITNMEQTVS